MSLFATLVSLLITFVDSQQQLYDVELYSMSSEPVISLVNDKGKGYSPCQYSLELSAYCNMLTIDELLEIHS